MDINSNREQVSKNEKARSIPCNIVNGLGIVITEKNYVIGNNNTGHWFLLREKYCFTGTIKKIVNCDDCGKNTLQKMVTFYTVDIDGEEFLVNKEQCVEYNQPIDNTVANKGRYQDFLEPGIFYPEGNDYVKQTEKITGMKNKTTPDYANDDSQGGSLYSDKYKKVSNKVGEK